MKVIEIHSGLSALLAERSSYGGFWISSLTHAAINGLPDNELVPLGERISLVEQIRRITTKPIIVDVDTFGMLEHTRFYAKWFERIGTFAIVMEDKRYPKQNSLLENGQHQLEDIDVFCEKIRIAKQNAKQMKIIARLESLIAKHSMEEALERADNYVKAGADMILIHSKQQIDCSEVMEFAKRFGNKAPLVAIPTTYTLPENHPFEIVIYANHLLRASMKAMERFLDGKEAELSSVKDIFNLVGY